MHGLKAKATIRGVEPNATPWRYGTIKLLEIRLWFLFLLSPNLLFERPKMCLAVWPALDFCKHKLSCTLEVVCIV